MLWELTNPKKAKASYAAFGREMSPRRLTWWTSGSKDKGIDFADVGRKEFWYRRSPYADWKPMVSDFPAELLIERAAAMTGVSNLVALGRLKDNALAFDVLSAALLKHNNPYIINRRVILALAEIGNPKAVDVFARMLTKQPTHSVGITAEALLLLDEPAGAKVLREIIGREIEAKYDKEVKYYKENVVPLAEAVLSALEGKPKQVVKLLGSKQQPLRLAAARYLARKGDVRAIPVLLAEASADKRGLHIALREQIVAMGKITLKPLGKIQADTKDDKEKLLCEVIRLRITNPKLTKAFERACQVHDPGFGTCKGPDVGDYRTAGKRIAKAVGPEAVPLLEAAVVWGRGGREAFALAEFKQSRSIDVLVKYSGGVGRARAAHALKDFGEAGIAAAKKVPVADPNKARFDRRVRRHRTAASVLALAEAPKGVEEIIKGLKLAAAGKIRLDQTRVYMHLAARYNDKRLIEPVILVLENQTYRYRYSLVGWVLEVLSQYDDKRIVPVCLKHLPRRGALRGLGKVKGKGLVEFLIKRLAGADDENTRIGIIKVIGSPPSSYNPNVFGVMPTLNDQETQRLKRLIARTLIEHLQDPSQSVQKQAADKLAVTSYQHNPDRKKATAALIAWGHRQERLSHHVTEYLAWTKDPNAGPLLHKIFRKTPLYGYYAAKALSGLKYEKAIPDVAAEIRRRVTHAQRLGVEEHLWDLRMMDFLGGFGKSGCKEVYEIMQQYKALPVQVAAACALSQRHYEKGFAETQKLFEELIAAGPDDPRVKNWRGRNRLDSYRSITAHFADLLCIWDAKKAYPIILKASLETTDEHLSDGLSRLVLEMEQIKPKPKDAK